MDGLLCQALGRRQQGADGGHGLPMMGNWSEYHRLLSPRRPPRPSHVAKIRAPFGPRYKVRLTGCAPGTNGVLLRLTSDWLDEKPVASALTQPAFGPTGLAPLASCWWLRYLRYSTMPPRKSQVTSEQSRCQRQAHSLSFFFRNQVVRHAPGKSGTS